MSQEKSASKVPIVGLATRQVVDLFGAVNAMTQTFPSLPRLAPFRRPGVELYQLAHSSRVGGSVDAYLGLMGCLHYGDYLCLERLAPPLLKGGRTL
jgi:hypothetical protein